MAVQALCTEQLCYPLCPAGSGLRCPPAMGQPCSLPTTGLRSWATAVFSAGTKLAISAGKRGVESFLSTCEITFMGSRVDHKSFLYSIWMLWVLRIKCPSWGLALIFDGTVNLLTAWWGASGGTRRVDDLSSERSSYLWRIVSVYADHIYLTVTYFCWTYLFWD